MVDIQPVNGEKGLFPWPCYRKGPICHFGNLATGGTFSSQLYHLRQWLVSIYRYGYLSTHYPVIVAHGSCQFVFPVRRTRTARLAVVGVVLLGAFLIQYRPGVRLLDSPKTLGFFGVALCGT